MIMREIENSNEWHIHETVADSMAEVYEHLNDEDAKEVFKKWGAWNNGLFDFDDAESEVLKAWQERPEIGIYGAAGQVAIDRLIDVTLSKEVDLEKKLAEHLGEYDLEGFWVAATKHHLIACSPMLETLLEEQHSSPSKLYELPTVPESLRGDVAGRSFSRVFKVEPVVTRF